MGGGVAFLIFCPHYCNDACDDSAGIFEDRQYGFEFHILVFPRYVYCFECEAADGRFEAENMQHQKLTDGLQAVGGLGQADEKSRHFYARYPKRL